MSEQPVTVYLDLTPEQQAYLADNNISITEILAQHNIPAQVDFGVLPSEQSDLVVHTKDVATIIIVSASLVLAVGAAISQVLRTVHNRPQVVESVKVEVVRDAAGNPVLDANGNVQTIRQTEKQLLQPDGNTSTNMDVSVGSGGLVLKVTSSQQDRTSGNSQQP